MDKLIHIHTSKNGFVVVVKDGDPAAPRGRTSPASWEGAAAPVPPAAAPVPAPYPVSGFPDVYVFNDTDSLATFIENELDGHVES